jgi:hypothetical protein
MPKPEDMSAEAAKLQAEALATPDVKVAQAKLAEAAKLASDAGELTIQNAVEVDVKLDPPLAPITRSSRLEVP